MARVFENETVYLCPRPQCLDVEIETEAIATEAKAEATFYRAMHYTEWSKKVTPRKCTPILTIFSLLEQEIYGA